MNIASFQTSFKFWLKIASIKYEVIRQNAVKMQYQLVHVSTCNYQNSESIKLQVSEFRKIEFVILK